MTLKIFLEAKILLFVSEKHPNGYIIYCHTKPIPVVARSKAWVCRRSLAGIIGSNPAKDMNVCLL
jgi:hypothetical protein